MKISNKCKSSRANGHTMKKIRVACTFGSFGTRGTFNGNDTQRRLLQQKKARERQKYEPLSMTL
jgi:hypothetical protein